MISHKGNQYPPESLPTLIVEKVVVAQSLKANLNPLDSPISFNTEVHLHHRKPNTDLTRARALALPSRFADRGKLRHQTAALP